MSNTEKPSAIPAQPSCSSGSCCGDCGDRAPTTGTTAPSTADASQPATIANASLGDVLFRALTIHPDQRGNVRETYRTSWFPEIPRIIRQLVRSQSEPQTLRGLHLHRKQWDIWHFVEGEALVRLRDASGGDVIQRVSPATTIAIPPGVAHGFYTDEGCILLYALTEEYDGSDEYGFYPFDGLTEDSHPGWPRDHIGIRVSERDLRAPRLADFIW